MHFLACTEFGLTFDSCLDICRISKSVWNFYGFSFGPFTGLVLEGGEGGGTQGRVRLKGNCYFSLSYELRNTKLTIQKACKIWAELTGQRFTKALMLIVVF